MKYEVLEHTADVGIRAYGRDLNEIFENAAYGMFDLMTDVSKIKRVGEYEVVLESPDLESLMVDWLTELLYIHETKQLFLSDFRVKINDSKLRATVRGEEIDVKGHTLRMLIKAATYHMMEINEKEGYATIIFDI